MSGRAELCVNSVFVRTVRTEQRTKGSRLRVFYCRVCEGHWLSARSEVKECDGCSPDRPCVASLSRFDLVRISGRWQRKAASSLV